MDNFLDVAGPNTLHVIAGSMRGGKTLELIARLNQASYRNIPIQAIKPSCDVRPEICSGPQFIASRGIGETTVTFPATVIPDSDPKAIFNSLKIDPYGIIGIEEAHLFERPSDLVTVTLGLRARGFAVLVCGLDRDFRGEPYEIMSTLMGHATTVRKYFGACRFQVDGSFCGKKAEFTQRLVNGVPADYSSDVKLVGDQQYEPRCHKHHIVPERPW